MPNCHAMIVVNGCSQSTVSCAFCLLVFANCFLLLILKDSQTALWKQPQQLLQLDNIDDLVVGAVLLSCLWHHRRN